MSKEEIIEVEENEQEEKELKGIRISENWVLSGDAMNLVLDQYGYKINKKEKDLSKQKTYGFIKRTWHSNLQQVFNYIIDRTAYGLDFGDLESVNSTLIELKNMVKDFKNCTNLNKSTLSVINK